MMPDSWPRSALRSDARASVHARERSTLCPDAQLHTWRPLPQRPRHVHLDLVPVLVLLHPRCAAMWLRRASFVPHVRRHLGSRWSRGQTAGATLCAASPVRGDMAQASTRIASRSDLGDETVPREGQSPQQHQIDALSLHRGADQRQLVPPLKRLVVCTQLRQPEYTAVPSRYPTAR